MQIYMKMVKNQAQAPAQPQAQLVESQKAPGRPLKARNPDLYHGNLHIKFYHFCQEYEDHFETTKAKSYTRVLFAALFLCGKMNFCWQQYKIRVKQEKIALLAWDKFKAFLRKNLGDSTSFVNNIWSKIRRDSQYQYEEVQDWVSHLEYLQSIFVEFNTKCLPSKDLLA